MPVENDMTEEEKAEFAAMESGTPAPPASAPAELPAPAPAEPPATVPEAEVTSGEAEAAAEAPKPGEPGSKHRADGTFKNKEELEADATAIAEAEAKAAKPQKMVPHQALHESREREKAATRQAQLAMTRMNAMLAQRLANPPQPEAMPDFATKPIEYVQTLEQRLMAMEQERQEQEQFGAIDNALTQDEEMFKQLQPDYDDASLHYVKSRYAELSQFYPLEQIQRMLVAEARQIAQQSWQRGIPAAQTVYALAKARGYVVAQPGEPAPQPTPPAPPAPAPAAAPTPASIVAAAAAGQQASRSLSGGNGSATATLNAEAVLSMSDEQFDEYLKAGTKGADTRFAALFGG